MCVSEFEGRYKSLMLGNGLSWGRGSNYLTKNTA
ncbi:hypothetical protein [Helicobacter felistomachi]